MLKAYHLLVGVAVIGLIIIAFSLTDLQSTPRPYEEYLRYIEKERKAKDAMMRESQQSPLSDGQKAQFQGLDYYEVDTTYRVIARLERVSSGEDYTLQTSKSGTQTYQMLGWAHFSIKGISQKALVFLSQAPGKQPIAFFPFLDETSGLETYGAGRYLEMPLPEGNELELDFNMAFNPFCAYSADWNCPMPPRENHLEVAIKAGEKGMIAH